MARGGGPREQAPQRPAGVTSRARGGPRGDTRGQLSDAFGPRYASADPLRLDERPEDRQAAEDDQGSLRAGQRGRGGVGGGTTASASALTETLGRQSQRGSRCRGHARVGIEKTKR